MAKFEVPGIKERDFSLYNGLNFKKTKKICVEKVAGVSPASCFTDII